MTVYFDDSLGTLATIIGREVGKDSLLEGIALRDISGRLSFYVPRVVGRDDVARISQIIRDELGPYARSDLVFAGANELDVGTLLQDPTITTVWTGQTNIRLIDRRLVGADWLRQPSEPAPPPPRFVFASLKGGVGRSTALSIAALDFASRGKRVLAIDLDMEAPGLGSILLEEDTTPDFGMIDALVENDFGNVDDQFIADLVGPSGLAGRIGSIDVIPAFGKRSLLNPGEILSKLSRAYTEDIAEDGSIATILDQVRAIVDRVANEDRYDVVLIDARAGLHETTAASVLGLGAEIFFFGLNEPQTFQGYAALFAHLARFIPNFAEEPEWLSRITMVQGRADSMNERDDFYQKFRQLFIDVGLIRGTSGASDAEQAESLGFSDLVWNNAIPDRIIIEEVSDDPVQVISILEDPRFRSFQPNVGRNLYNRKTYGPSYNSILDRMWQIVDLQSQIDGADAS